MFEIQEQKFNKPEKRPFVELLVLFVILSAVVGGGIGALLAGYYWQGKFSEMFEQYDVLPAEKETIIKDQYIPQTTQEQKIIQAVKKYSPAVVSIIATKDVPIMTRYYLKDPFGFLFPQYREEGTEKKQVGAGSGFIISQDGMILTNKHVVTDEAAEYTAFLNDGTKYQVQVLARDPFYDLAVLKIVQEENLEEERRTFLTADLGDSSLLQTGQTVIAIGNALGELKNTVSVGVISGLSRDIVAVGDGVTEALEGVIQTDVAINPGNSGGPLLNLAGEVIGINVARSTGGENIGFSLPVNTAKRAIEQVKEHGEIVYPFLGIYYTMINEELGRAHDLPVDYGAWVGRDAMGEKADEAIFANSPASKASIQRDDIILEFDGEKLTAQNSLTKVIVCYKPGDEVTLKILRDGQEILKQVTLDRR
jgi:serine protease Do